VVSESAVTAGSTDRWYSLFGWGVAALLFSFVLSNVAILAGALPALILEFGQRARSASPSMRWRLP